MLTENIYVAGGMYFPNGDTTKLREFGLVHNTGEDRPYLTKSSRGLKLTANHANLYRLSADLKRALLVDYRTPLAGRAVEVELTELQRHNVKLAIETEYFFN